MGETPSPQVHRTNNLKRFIKSLTTIPKPHVLDMGRLCGQNIDWLLQKGCKVYIDDRFVTLKPPPKPVPTSRKGEWKLPPSPPIEPLEYPAHLFDGILCWDLLDFLVLKQAQELIGGIKKIIKPKGFLLTYFNFNKSKPPPPVRYRIIQEDQLQYEILLSSQISRRVYENREIEALFQGFEIINSTFLKNQMREVLVQKQ
ncbi:MAG TPA: hypothetical protein VGB26_03570 [Nitrospiria bacterium]